MRLIDQHCHSVVHDDLPDPAFASLLTESDRPPADGTSPWDSSLGLAVRRWCPPLLDLDPYPSPGDYLDRRRELGPAESTRRLLRGAGLETCCIDTGLDTAAGAALLSLDGFATASGSAVREVVRLEQIAEQASPGSSAATWAGQVDAALAAAVRDRRAVAVKSVLAYRHGLDITATRPAPAEVANAASEYLSAAERHGSLRLDHPVLLRHLLWTAVDLGLPIQLHTGFGDPDLTLHRADPSLLTDFVRAVEPHGVPLVLLHCYPYHRQAAWLAQSFPHVYCDLGLTLGHTGLGARPVLAETLELAPYGKVLFSTDAFGLPELYVVGVAAFRDAVAAWTAALHATGCPAPDSDRLAALIGADNSRRLYGL
ncbi:amidohydrolase family protein [Streptacidiphilus sp. EB129]|uniref:amidohydrolase family protein n=1 Tax=Streptacidiphilus sp. EB129 TaxID=3156262 RepID=UPI003516619E